MLKIQGKQKIQGSVTLSGSKNAVLPMIGASLLTDHITLTNVPDISDTHVFLDILNSIGSKTTFKDHTVTIDNSSLSAENMDLSGVGKLRASYYLIPGLLYRFGEAYMQNPGGCNLGKRPLDYVIKGFEELGFESLSTDTHLHFKKVQTTDERTVYGYFSVGATLNLLMGSMVVPGTTYIKLAAFEPHVKNVIDLLRAIGADIKILYDHTIVVQSHENLEKKVEARVVSDYLQSGTFAIMGSLCAKDYIDIHNAAIPDLTAFLYKLHEAGVHTEDMGNDTLRVHKADNLKAVNVQTNIYPGFPTDLQSPFAILMTQAEGSSRLHEVLFEGRLNWLVEIENMWGNIALMNPHEAMIVGKTNLQGTTVNSWDLRSGAAMVIAGMIANGETTVTKVHHIERGYEDLVGKLQALGAKIEKIPSN